MVIRCVVVWLEVSVGANSFGWFPVGFGWFLLVEDNFRWFQVVFCFSSHTNFTAYRRVTSLLYSLLHMIYWGQLILLFKVKQQEKYCCCLVASENKWLFSILCCVLRRIKRLLLWNFFWIKSHKAQTTSV